MGVTALEVCVGPACSALGQEQRVASGSGPPDVADGSGARVARQRTQTHRMGRVKRADSECSDFGRSRFRVQRSFQQSGRGRYSPSSSEELLQSGGGLGYCLNGKLKKSEAEVLLTLGRLACCKEVLIFRP